MEGDVFRIIVPLNDNFLDYGDRDGTGCGIQMIRGTQSTGQATQSSIQFIQREKAQQDILVLIGQEPELSQKQIAARLELNVNTVKYYIRKMQEQGKVGRIGSARKGKWVVREKV